MSHQWQRHPLNRWTTAIAAMDLELTRLTLHHTEVLISFFMKRHCNSPREPWQLVFYKKVPPAEADTLIYDILLNYEKYLTEHIL